MRKKEINIYLLQETWDEGDYTQDLGGGYILFHHNSRGKQDKTGVGIIIAPRIADVWRLDGSKPAVSIKQFEGRFIGISIKLPKSDLNGERVKDKWDRLLIASVYHPYKKTHNAFNTELDDTLPKLSKDHDIIMGGDMNAQVGRRRDSNPDSYEEVLGPYGLDSRNEKGRETA